MNRTQFIAMSLDVKKHPENLSKYRKLYKNVYLFSDGIFKILMANEAKTERTVKFLNAMLGLTDKDAIKSFKFGVPENPGVLTDKTVIFDIYGTTEAGNPVLIEVQQNYNRHFIDRIIYYTSRVVSRTVKKSQTYRLPHIYVLALLTDNLFSQEKDCYFHHSQIIRNNKYAYDKLDIYFVEIEKFFDIEDRSPVEQRECSSRADMLRLFRDVLEEKEISDEKLKNLLDKDFLKDVSFKLYTDEILLKEFDGMIDLLYEREGAYFDAKAEDAKAMLAEGDSIEKVMRITKLTEKEVLELQAELDEETVVN